MHNRWREVDVHGVPKKRKFRYVSEHHLKDILNDVQVQSNPQNAITAIFTIDREESQEEDNTYIEEEKNKNISYIEENGVPAVQEPEEGHDWFENKYDEHHTFLEVLDEEPLDCPNCGAQTTANICQCGTILKEE